MSDLVERCPKEAAMLREIAQSYSRGVDWQAYLSASAAVIDLAAARITELETALAEAEGRVKKMERALGNIRALATKHQAVCGPDGNWAHVEGFAATALETGEWKK